MANSAPLTNGAMSMGTNCVPPATPRTTTAREGVQTAVDYYNNRVLKARVGAGLTRSSVNERHLANNKALNMLYNLRNHNPNTDPLYRSNSSLELSHEQAGEIHQRNDAIINQYGLRREYGSHGSIDAMINERSPTTGESFFAMLQDYRPAVLSVISNDQRSPGPSEYLKGRVNVPTNSSSKSNHSLPVSLDYPHVTDITDVDGQGKESPKLRQKFQRLWGPSKSNRSSANPDFGPIVINSVMTQSNSSIPQTVQNVATSSADIEERQRRRAFAHYDCQSITANLGYAAKLRGLLLARRRNTTTGASAASMLNSKSATPDGVDSGDEDFGDGQSNELIENCPYFRNEIGGEQEREVSLTRFQSNNSRSNQIHRPPLAYGVSVLESPPGESLWKPTTCPFQKGTRPVETVDVGANYYFKHFIGQEHQNWFGIDEQLGPVAISIKREKLPQSQTSTIDITNEQRENYLFRMIVRTSELLTLRGSVVEDSIPNPRGPGKPASTKDILEYVAPEIQINSLRLGMVTQQCEQQLVKLDEQGLTNKYKVGILYCRADQSTEEDMYNNEMAGPALTEFLELIGKKVRLKGFEHYKGGLDTKTDSTGTHSLYATYQECEIMFHVSTMLPFTPSNGQQLLRKRHIGNDIVTIVFQEPGARPFTPKNIRSQFQHVFIIVRVVNPCQENTCYRVAVSRSKEVPVFGPPIKSKGLFPKGRSFVDFLLAKVINAENAAHRSEKFATMATRTRQEYLKDLVTNYCTTTPVDNGPKFSLFPSKKKEKPKPRFSGDIIQRGAFCWHVLLMDCGQSMLIDCFLGISADTFVLIEECSRQIVFVAPCKSILGWSTNPGNQLHIYHHQGECITLNMRDGGERDEQLEVIERLRSVTSGCGAIELNLRRNPMGQLGFHVQPDGVVTQVEISGQAWLAGLRQGYRLVEICKVAVSTLYHDQMVDLLKTSAQVTVTVIESFPDGSPRRGCSLQNCKFNIVNYEDECENTQKSPDGKRPLPQLQQPVANQRKRYERNFSPPRSCGSSGYGTGSSSRSFSIPNEQLNSLATDMGTLTSSSSEHSSNGDRWYDTVESRDDSSAIMKKPPATHKKIQHSSSLPLSNGTRPLKLLPDTNSIVNQSTDSNHKSTNSAYSNKVSEISDFCSRNAIMEHLVSKPNQTAQYYQMDNQIRPINVVQSKDLYAELNSHSIDLPNLNHQSIGKPRPPSNNSNTGGSGTGTVSSSASSSRNNSPRPLTEAKLRPAALNRNNLHRNSVNCTSSNFQEELLKLINPEYISADDNFNMGNISKLRADKISATSHSLGNISHITARSSSKESITTDDIVLMKSKSRSREGINLGSQAHPITTDLKIKPEADVIFTKARPATIIASSPASKKLNGLPATPELFIKEDNYQVTSSPSKDKYNARSSRDLTSALAGLKKQHPDWNNFTDTDVKNMIQQVNDTLNRTSLLTSGLNGEDLYSFNGDSHSNQSDTSSIAAQSEYNTPNSLTPSSSGHSNNIQMSSKNGHAVPVELQGQVSHLEECVMRETRRRKSLEQKVKHLTEENRRLQDESQAAVQQLRRFTEWFFQTIDRQP